MITAYILIPVTGTVAAWVASRLLLAFLVKPVQPITIGKNTIQGALPYLQQNPGTLAAAVAQKAKEVIATKMHNANMGEVRPLIAHHLDNYLTIRLKEKMPVIASFIGPSTTEKLKESMIEEIDTLLPQVIETYVAKNFTVEAIEEIITRKIADISPAEIEAFLQKQKNKIKRFTIVTTLTGFCVGIIADVFYYLSAVQ